MLEAGKKYKTRNGIEVLCQGRDKQYPANFVMLLLLYPNPYKFPTYLVFEDGTDTWRNTDLDVIGEAK